MRHAQLGFRFCSGVVSGCVGGWRLWGWRQCYRSDWEGLGVRSREALWAGLDQRAAAVLPSPCGALGGWEGSGAGRRGVGMGVGARSGWVVLDDTQEPRTTGNERTDCVDTSYIIIRNRSLVCM